MSSEEAFALACAAYLDAVPPDARPPAEKVSLQRSAKGPSRPADISQKQRDCTFLSHKQHVLSNLAGNACDYSPKGGVDRKCHSVMSVLNAHADYVTTSSCSGRIALFHSSQAVAAQGGNGAAMKRGDADAMGWLLVKHGALNADETDAVVRLLCGPETSSGTNANSNTNANTNSHTNSNTNNNSNSNTNTNGNANSNTNTNDNMCEHCDDDDELDGVWVRCGALRSTTAASASAIAIANGSGSSGEVPTTGCVALKVEPFVMHVACRTMDSAKRLLSAAASDAGFRNSGITPPGRRTMCAIRHAAGHGMDVPLVVDGVNYAAGQHAYVRRLLQLAGEKMRGNDARIQRLEECVKARLADPESP